MLNTTTLFGICSLNGRHQRMATRSLRLISLGRSSIFVLMLLLTGLTAQAQKTWTGTTTDWNTASNWSPTGVPTTSDDVVIPAKPANQPLLSTTAVANSVEVQSGASLSITAAGSLTLNGAKDINGNTAAFYNGGLVDNSGQLIIGNTAAVGNYGILNGGTFNNNTGGEIRIDQSSNAGLFNGGPFNNAARLIIGANAGVGDFGIDNNGEFTNQAGGELAIDNVGNIGLYLDAGNLTNYAKITIGANVGGYAIANQQTFINSGCSAIINTVGTISGNSAFSNSGTIIENATGNSNIGTNTGIVQNLNGGMFNVGSGPNQPLSLTTVDATACSPANGSITINGLKASTTYTLSYTVNGASSTVSPNPTSNASGQLTATGLAAGNYALTLGGTCVPLPLSLSASLNGPASVTASLVSSGTLTCIQTSVTLTASGGDSYQFSQGATQSGSDGTQATVTQQGVYSVTAISANGCSAVASTTVTSSTVLSVPSLQASSLSIINQPISVTATGCPGGTINWNSQGGTGTASGSVYTFTQPGSYTLSATCSINECVRPASQALSLTIQVGGPLRAVAPTYNCATGAITFNTLGGDGTLIEYFAIGITPWTTNPNQTVEAGLRGDPKILELHVRQSGIEVTYSFDLPAFCSGIQPPPPPTPNQPPVVNTTITTQTAIVGSAYTLSLPAGTFTDPESQTLTYSALGLPAGLTLVGTTISGTPTAEGFATVTIIAQDPSGLTANTSFGLSVLPQNPQPPTGGGLTLLTPLYNCESGAITFRTSGGDGSPVEYFAIGVTGWTSQANQTVEPGLRADPKTLTLHARQNGTEATTLNFDLKAYCSGPPVNQPPLLVTPISNQTALVNASYSFVISGSTFSDPENGLLTYSISGLPAGLSASGLLISGIPSQTGVSTVNVLAIDNGGLTASTSFLLTVVPSSTTTVSPPPPGGPLSLIAPIYTCATGAITFQTTGGDGSQIEYFAIGITPWTTNPNHQVEAGLRADPKAITLHARQSGTEVTYNFDLPNACPASGRVMAEATIPLSVKVLGNPVTNDRLQVEIRGALDESLHLQLLGEQALPVHELRLEKATSVEQLEFDFSPPAGLYFLKVSTPTQQQVVKIIKQ